MQRVVGIALGYEDLIDHDKLRHDDSETDVLSYLDFPEQHRSKLHCTNPLDGTDS
jgi:hypothetical protein